MQTASTIRAHRRRLRSARRIVVKVGSRVLVGPTGRPDLRRLRGLTRAVAALHNEGREVVLVSSGAIGAGLHALGMSRRPTALPDLQMAAAVGQGRLMRLYGDLFAEHGCVVGQVLLTHGDLNERVRHLNARNTMMQLLRNRVIPIVNENDVVAVDEIRFGDNDLLASLAAILIQADALVLLTTVEGFMTPDSGGAMRRVPFLERVDDAVLGHAQGKGDALSTGGMASKLRAAANAARVQASVVIADGRRPSALGRIFRGADVGTLVANAPAGDRSGLSGRKRWIGFFHRGRGGVVVDDGAVEALVRKGRSLLPIGIRAVKGPFKAGEVVQVWDAAGRVVARGLAELGSDDAQKALGLKTHEIERVLGPSAVEEFIHRDNLVVLNEEAVTESDKGGQKRKPS